VLSVVKQTQNYVISQTTGTICEVNVTHQNPCKYFFVNLYYCNEHEHSKFLIILYHILVTLQHSLPNLFPPALPVNAQAEGGLV